MDKLENKTIKILYGSETGNAQEFAEQIWKKCRKTIPVECLAIDDYPIHNLCEESTAIFIVSTSGQGEVPTNMRKNWTFLLSKKLPEKCWLSKTKIAVLGLGDSSYQKYNYAGKKIFRRLVQLGAQPILQLSLADDQHRLGIDEMFEKWQSELMETEPFKSLESDKNKIFSNIGGGQSSKFYPLELVENERLTAENHFQETRLITFSLENVKDSSNFRYSPGDVLMVLPENLEATIEIAKNSLKSCEQYFNSPISSACQLDQFIARVPQFLRIKASPEPTFIECLQFYFDLQCIPKRNFVKEMAGRAADGIEKERLVELSSSEGIDDYLDYCIHSRRTTAEFLRDFPETSANLIPSDLFAFFPAIRPRGFSIASSPNAHSDRIQILVARVEYAVRKMKASRLGLCSNFLCTAKPGIKVFLRIRPGIFQHANSEEPLILVGPGTGVAPFRSFISQNELASPGCKILLFFGCRGQYRDFYFRDEWSRCSKAQIVTAFSRDQEKKVYVQHKIVRNGKQIWELLNQGGRIFIAGASGDMPKQVVAALKNVLIGFGGISLDEADKQIELMEKKKRLQYETWC